MALKPDTDAPTTDEPTLTDDEQAVFDVIATHGMVSENKLIRKLDHERYEIRALTRQLETRGIIVSKGRDSFAYNVARYALTRVGQQHAEGTR
jgi:hemerythrin-like domain-containing protein